MKREVNTEQVGDYGHVLLDSAWVEVFLKHPRALYLLLKAFDQFQSEEGIQEPLVTIVGDKEVANRIKVALRSYNSGLNGLGTYERHEDLEPLLARFDQLIHVIQAKDVPDFITKHKHGVSVLRTSDSNLKGIEGVADFVLDILDVNVRDIPAVVFVLPRMLKAAQLIRDIDDSDLRIAELKENMKDIFPEAAAQGDSFVIDFATYLAQVLIHNEYISTQA